MGLAAVWFVGHLFVNLSQSSWPAFQSAIGAERSRVSPIIGKAFSPQPCHVITEALPHSYGETTVWLMESCIGFSVLRMGLPGAVSQFFFVSPIPVFSQIITSKSIGKLPLLPYSSMFVNGILWFCYGGLTKNPAVWVTNLPPIVLGAIYTATFCRHCPADADWLPSNRGVHVSCMIITVLFVSALIFTQDATVAADVIGTIAVGVCIVMFSGPLAALRTVMKERSTANLPLTTTIATILNCSLWTFYGTQIAHDPFIWIPNVLGLISGLAQASLFVAFGFGSSASSEV